MFVAEDESLNRIDKLNVTLYDLLTCENLHLKTKD